MLALFFFIMSGEITISTQQGRQLIHQLLRLMLGEALHDAWADNNRMLQLNPRRTSDGLDIVAVISRVSD